RTRRQATGLLQHDERVALVDRLALLAADLRDGARVFGLHWHLHLHRLEDRDRVALLDRVADGALDLPSRPGDVSLDVSPALLPAARRQPPGTIADGRLDNRCRRRPTGGASVDADAGRQAVRPALRRGAAALVSVAMSSRPEGDSAVRGRRCGARN